MSTYVHRIPPIDKSSPHILANISSKSSDTKTLDLEIEATEGVNVFYASLPSSSLTSSLAKGSNLSSAQWRHILRILLLHDTSSSEDVDISNIELVARLDTSASLSTSHSSADSNSNDTPTSATLRFRRNISGIHKTIADIILPLDEDHPIDTISWTATAVQQASSLQSELTTQIAKTSKAESQVESLKSQLEELLAAKKDHETESIARFALLLNEKKAKIRELQSQNAVTPFPRGQVSPPAEDEPMLAIESAPAKGRGPRGGARGRGRGRGKAAAAPRGAKRKEPPKEEPEPAEESDVEMTKQQEDDDETTDEEEKIVYTDEDRGKMDEGASTDMDGTTDEEGDGSAPPKSTSKTQANSESKSTANSTNANAKGKGKAIEVHTLPPRRELPFGNTSMASEDPKTDKNESTKMDVDDDASTTDDDDEL